MVVDDVDPHLEVAVVGGGDQLGQLGGGIVAGGVLPVHGAEGERHVPPVAALLRIVLVHREQFDDAEAEGGDAVELADQGPVGARRRDPGLGRGHAADVRLVDDRGTARTPRRAGRRPRRGPGDWRCDRSSATPCRHAAARLCSGGNTTSVADGSSSTFDESNRPPTPSATRP